ncbi:hypothetical protein KJ840_02635 [Patescibacteria group bacterium]|nr:hypothetical protein [Patescibacteria group bacterium]
MKLSALQKFILGQAYGKEKRINRSRFYRFYNGRQKPPKGEDKVKIVTKSIERLIDKGLMVGFGQRTKYKWYIKDVQLTAPGRRLAKKMMGEQTQLPFKK